MAKLNTLADRLKRIQDNRELTNLRNQIASVPQADDTALREATARAQNAMNTPFTYNYQNDPSYKALYDAAVRNGKLAMKDTMGKATALTGGYANSYAQQVGQQTYNDYMSKLNEQIPALENAAYQRYRQGIADAIQSVDLEKLLYGAAVDRRNERVSEAQNMYNNLYKVVGDDTDAYNKALATDVGLANIPYENQQKIELQTAIDRMQMQNNIAENKAKNADDLAYQKALVEAGAKRDYQNNPVGGVDKTSTEYGRLNTNINNYIKSGNYKGAGDEIASYINEGYMTEDDGMSKYLNAMRESVSAGKITEYKAVDEYISWVKNTLGYDLTKEQEQALREEVGMQIWGADEYAMKEDVDEEFLNNAWKKAKQAGVYKKDFVSFMHDFDSGRVKVFKNGKVQ